MAIASAWHYRSRLAAHEYRLWLADASVPADSEAGARNDALHVRIDRERFRTALAAPRLGRFYPARMLNLAEPAPGPVFRISALDEAWLRADFNPPCAGLAVERATGDRIALPAIVLPPGTRLREAGMEAPLAHADTDYDEPDACSREAPADDARFYAQPRRVLHVDAVCAARITDLYQSLLAGTGRVLDLMAGWRSHLPAGMESGRVSGLGMNAEEMTDNPQLDDCCVHDLNTDPRLPYADASFDAVVNTVSIEYLTDPGRVLREARRVLRPGGRLVITASQRYFPPKAIALWTRLHPMERLGWVLVQLHAAGFRRLHSRVERGLKRAADDRYADSLAEMDPLYAAWGEA